MKNKYNWTSTIDGNKFGGDANLNHAIGPDIKLQNVNMVELETFSLIY